MSLFLKKPSKLKHNPYILTYFFQYLVTDFEPEEFEIFLGYLHTEMCVIYPEILPSLLSIADHYEVLPLARSCIAAFDDVVTIENVSPTEWVLSLL